jgi:hypothetical protein
VPAPFRCPTAEGKRGRYMLHRAPHFNVTSVVWVPGDRAGTHNPATWGVIGVVDNEIEETRYRVTPGGRGRAHVEVKEVFRPRATSTARTWPDSSGRPELLKFIRSRFRRTACCEQHLECIRPARPRSR